MEKKYDQKSHFERNLVRRNDYKFTKKGFRNFCRKYNW